MIMSPHFFLFYFLFYRMTIKYIEGAMNRVTTKLTIYNVQPNDLGLYTCESRNIKGSTQANINLKCEYSYITNLVCYTYVHWFFSPECQHIFGKQTGYIFQSPKTIKTWTTKHYASLNQWYNTE